MTRRSCSCGGADPDHVRAGVVSAHTSGLPRAAQDRWPRGRRHGPVPRRGHRSRRAMDRHQMRGRLLPRRACAAFQQAGFTPQGFIAARFGLALIPALALGVLHDGVAVRRLHHANKSQRHVLAATRPAISGTVPVQARSPPSKPKPTSSPTPSTAEARHALTATAPPRALSARSIFQAAGLPRAEPEAGFSRRHSLASVGRIALTPAPTVPDRDVPAQADA